MSDKIAEIKDRHKIADLLRGGPSVLCPQIHDDRGVLLAEVERQTQLIEALECIQRETVVERHRLAEGVSQVSALRAEVERARKERDEARAEVERLRAEVERLRERKNGAYLERNQVVSALSKCFPSGVTRTAIEGWAEDWHGCVLIDLPTGQASWHFHDSQAHLFAHLPPYQKAWDGHDTPEKYRRLATLSATTRQSNGEDGR